MIDSEALQANTEAVTALEKRLQVVQVILDEIANELGWLTRNLQDLSSGGSANHQESVYCMECDSKPVRSLAEALRQGWNELMLFEGRYMGMCAECLQAYEDRAEATRRTVTPEAFQREADVENGLVVPAGGDGEADVQKDEQQVAQPQRAQQSLF